MVLWAFLQRLGDQPATEDQLAKWIHVSPNSITSYMRRLRDAGLIRRHRAPGILGHTFEAIDAQAEQKLAEISAKSEHDSIVDVGTLPKLDVEVCA